MKYTEQRALWVSAISRRPIPAKPQFKVQERGDRHSSISETLRNSDEKEDHLGDRITPESLLFEPITGITGYKQYISRVVTVLTVAPETAYTESTETLTELLLELQRRNPFI